MPPAGTQRGHAQHVSGTEETGRPAPVKPSDEGIWADTMTVARTRITEELAKALQNS